MWGEARTARWEARASHMRKIKKSSEENEINAPIDDKTFHVVYTSG